MVTLLSQTLLLFFERSFFLFRFLTLKFKTAVRKLCIVVSHSYIHLLLASLQNKIMHKTQPTKRNRSVGRESIWLIG